MSKSPTATRHQPSLTNFRNLKIAKVGNERNLSTRAISISLKYCIRYRHISWYVGTCTSISEGIFGVLAGSKRLKEKEPFWGRGGLRQTATLDEQLRGRL